MNTDMTKFPMVSKKETAKRLMHFMKRNGLTPKDVQEYLGLTCVQTVYRWLEGINIPNVDNLYALSRLFHVKIDDMLAGNGYFITASDSCGKVFRLMAYYRLGSISESIR